MNLAYALALLFIFTGIYYSILGLSIYYDDKKSDARRRYVIASIWLTTWSLSYGLMAIADSDESAKLFWSAGFLSFCLFMPGWIDFLLRITPNISKYIKKNIIYIFYLIFFAIAASCIISNETAFVKTGFGYQFSYKIGIVFLIALVFLVLSLSIMLYLQFRWMRSIEIKQHKKYALRFTVLTIITAPPVLAFDILIPMLSEYTVPPLGCIFVLLVSIQLVYVMRSHRIINITVRDISEDIFSSVSQPILALSPDNRVVFANKAAYRFWMRNITGMNIAQLVMVNGSSPGQEFFEESFDIDEGITVSAGGETKYCSMLLSVVREKNSDILDKIIIIDDITKLQNAALREHEANQLKSRFLAKMGHEIRTPMNAIIGMTELALRETDPYAKDEHLVTVKQAGLNLLSIINDILDYSKIENGRLEIFPEEFPVSSLINDVINIIRMKALNTNIRFAVSIDCNIPGRLIGDETRIRQILINLLSNAVKYTNEGFVSLFIYSRQAEENKIELFFIVSDSGVGIRKEDIGKLFKDFSQLNANKKKSAEGLGLGLAITHNIVKIMGGSIKVQSDYGKGSIFTVILPLEYVSREPLAAVKNLDRKNILIYECRDVNVSSIIFTIDNLGVDHMYVSNDDEFIKKIKSFLFDFLFISYDLYRRNRNIIEIHGKNVEIVIISDFGETISEPDLNVLCMPLYCVPVANILNKQKKNKISYYNTVKQDISFTAPYANILVVDDMAVNLKVTSGLLLPYEMNVDLCSSGMEAIEAVKSKHYDIIFMDHRMPGMDGIETVRHIREWEKTMRNEELGMRNEDKNNSSLLTPNSSLVIIALTADAVAGSKEKFLENGFNGFLSKPIDTEKLNAVLEKWMPKEKHLKMSLLCN